ncbi:MAG TPA: hydroxymethylbilane synthase [Pirellulaceae bacterium]|nr:hydroxymethylbilane synthase [Pirellulaceae bacterium]
METEKMPSSKPKALSMPLNETRLRLGTRGSALARWQADWVTEQLQTAGVVVEQVLITTSGDVTSGPINEVGGQGLFTKEIQRALLDDRIDVAVHSLKDLPTESVAGLALSAVPPRADVGDAFVSKRFASLDDLPRRARVGTGSRRRQSQLLHLRPDLMVADIRGNVDTRLQKLDAGEYDAIILAQAGLSRLGLTDRITQRLSPDQMLPAVGQGALGIETRTSDETTIAAIAVLDDASTRAAVTAERTLLATLLGGCLAPVGAWARVDGKALTLDGVVLSTDGRQRIATQLTDELIAAARVGQHAAEKLLAQGAADLIAAARN